MNKYFLLLIALSLTAQAGDDASGSIPREMDLGAEYLTYELKEHDLEWSKSLVKNFGYKGKAYHFVKTNIPLLSNGKAIEGRIYQSVEKPDLYYVAEGDLMFKIGSQYPYSPSVGGFSMHAPKSRNFIVCLNCMSGGVPVVDSTKVVKGKIKWQGSEWNRL